jgi:putative SOS response-associated peptidase YedK
MSTIKKLMCGRYTFQPTEEFYRRFNITNRLYGLVARYNIAPSQLVPVIIAQGPNQVMLMRWGLIPHGAKEEKTTYKMINAQTASEQTLLVKSVNQPYWGILLPPHGLSV